MPFRSTIVAIPILLLPLPALVQGALAQGALAQGQDVSAWQHDGHAAARLIAGAAVDTPGGRLVRAGLEIRLDPGWDTYWRYPGDSGVPPTFNFDGSENVKAVAVQWPAPQRLPDGAGSASIGYAGDVILPLQVTQVDAGQSSDLHVSVSYAVCGTLCLPAKAELALSLPGAGTGEALLARAAQRVPRRVTLGPAKGQAKGQAKGAAKGNALAVLSVQREAGNRKAVTVEVAAPAGAPVQLFAEGPTPDWALPLPKPADAGNGEVRRFTFKLDGLPPGAHASGATLLLTAIAGGEAIEVPAHLD